MVSPSLARLIAVAIFVATHYFVLSQSQYIHQGLEVTSSNTCLLQKFIDCLGISESDDDPIPDDGVPTSETELASLGKLDQVGHEVVEHLAFHLRQKK